MAGYYQRTRCRMCDQATLTRVLTLTPTPPGNHYLSAEEVSTPQPTFPLEVYLCGVCGHVQLGHVVDPAILYQKAYTYVSGTSPVFVQHLRSYAADMVDRFALKAGSLVADIGSNDGTCLRQFASHGVAIIGIDPAPEIATRATADGVTTVCDFFSETLAVRLRAERGPAAFITSHNACAHIDHLDDVFRGVAHWLADDGVFVLEVGYFMDVYENMWFDTIYHEHLDYHTVRPFQALCARVGMEAFAVQRVSPQGGSLRLFTQRLGGPHKADGSIDTFIARERAHGLDRPDTFAEWGERIMAVGGQLRALLATLRGRGKSIAAYGAPTKAATLLAHFGIDHADLDFIVDDNPLKHGLASPVGFVPVFAPEELYRRRPDYALILAWNFADSIMSTHRKFVEQGGRWVVPMPVARVVE